MTEKIIESIFSNMEAPIVFLIVAVALRIINIVLGSVGVLLFSLWAL